MSTIAIILAAGYSSRFVNDTNKVKKQYSLLYNIPLLLYSIDSFLKNEKISNILIVISKGDENFYQMCVAGKKKILPFVYGGESRQESILNALHSLKDLNPKKVLIHDGCRPFISQRIINEEINLLDSKDSVIPVLPISDSVKKIDNFKNISSIDRKNLYRTQTPQAFLYKDYYRMNLSLKGKIHSFTDDLSLYENSDFSVALIRGEETNIKITNPSDISHIESNFPKQNKTIAKVGIGYDIHRMYKVEDPDNFMILGGVKIPSDYKIEAHSDGDVLIHSLVDAIFGTLGIGDIGCYFSDKDPLNKSRNSEDFLIFAKEKLKERGGIVGNIDLTVVCEKPKISPYKDIIALRLSKILDIEKNNINVKSTTNERLDSIGRIEGICVYCVVSICF